jgi:hypothetical protein
MPVYLEGPGHGASADPYRIVVGHFRVLRALPSSVDIEPAGSD